MWHVALTTDSAHLGPGDVTLPSSGPSCFGGSTRFHSGAPSVPQQQLQFHLLAGWSRSSSVLFSGYFFFQLSLPEIFKHKEEKLTMTFACTIS